MIDHLEAHFDRFFYYKNEQIDLFERYYDSLLLMVTFDISCLWRWWYGVSKDDKAKYKDKIQELKAFTKENIPLFGYSSWPLYLRLSTVFMRSDSWLSFAVLYGMNQLYRKLRPKNL